MEREREEEVKKQINKPASAQVSISIKQANWNVCNAHTYGFNNLLTTFWLLFRVFFFLNAHLSIERHDNSERKQQ